MAWLDWMDFYKGKDVVHLNDLALAEPGERLWDEAIERLSEYQEWKS